MHKTTYLPILAKSLSQAFWFLLQNKDCTAAVSGRNITVMKHLTDSFALLLIWMQMEETVGSPQICDHIFQRLMILSIVIIQLRRVFELMR